MWFELQEPQNLHEAAKAGDIEAVRRLLNDVRLHAHVLLLSVYSSLLSMHALEHLVAIGTISIQQKPSVIPGCPGKIH